ncbi:MAG: CHAT domain-containing protein [Bacteroidia bacterium]
MNDKDLAEVREMISRDNITGAFNKLRGMTLENNVSQSMILLEGRFNSLNRQVRMGTISYAESSVEKSRIVYGLIGLLDEIKSGTGSTTNTSSQTPVNQPQTNTTTVTTQTKILFLASNPGETGRLRLDKEYRDIEEGLRRATNRDKFKLSSRLAVRTKDLSRAMLEETPQIVHFSGHGVKSGSSGESDEKGTRKFEYSGKHGDSQRDDQNVSGEIILEGNDGTLKMVSAEALAGLFELFSEHIQCVFLNACYSQYQAEAIIKHVPYVIGMSRAVPDKVAIEFAVAFYDALGNGRDIEFAFKYAKSSVVLEGLSGSDIPVLVKREA